MKLTSPHKARERVLIYGQEGTGKTTAALQWADSITTHVHYLDTDNTLERFRDGDEWGGRDELWERLTAYDLNGNPFGDSMFAEYVEALREVWDAAEPDDLIVVDVIGPLWTEAEGHYIESVLGKDPLAHFVETRKKGKDKSALDGNKDWGLINRLYRPIGTLFRNPPCHILLLAEADKLDGRTSDKETLDLYGKVGWKPRGQKRTGHGAQTVLFARYANDERWMEVLKDRERSLETLEGENFATGYLLKRGKWKMEMGKKKGEEQ